MLVETVEPQERVHIGKELISNPAPNVIESIAEKPTAATGGIKDAGPVRGICYIAVSTGLHGHRRSHRP